MSDRLVDRIAEAVLYEGYILYPYRPSSTKNQHRFTFGRVYPEACHREGSDTEPCLMQTECLVRPLGPGAAVEVTGRFLQPMLRQAGQVAASGFQPLGQITVDGRRYQTWQEAVERSLEPQLLRLGEPQRLTHFFAFPAFCELEPILDADGQVAGAFRRERRALHGSVEVSATRLDAEVFKITVRITNQSPILPGDLEREETVLLHTLASTHAILSVREAEFFSLTDPPAAYAAATAACRNLGAWPVLVGDEARAERHTLLASPIILYDYPRLAPQSAGDLFDGTEIDEILSLRILTLTDGEKREMSEADEHARRILQRTESLSEEHFFQMHGAMRPTAVEAADFFGDHQTLDRIEIGGIAVRAGDRVRLHPQGRADIMDIALAGQVAIVEAIEQDAENRVYLAVVMEDDPGRDLGMMRQPGHRFFYTPAEVEPLQAVP